MSVALAVTPIAHEKTSSRTEGLKNPPRQRSADGLAYHNMTLPFHRRESYSLWPGLHDKSTVKARRQSYAGMKLLDIREKPFSLLTELMYNSKIRFPDQLERQYKSHSK